MKGIRDDMTGEEIAAVLIPRVEAEQNRRLAIYSAELALAPHLGELLPLFRLTHTARAQRCDGCGRRIPANELHFVSEGLRVCQDDTCMRGARDAPRDRSHLRLIVDNTKQEEG